MRDRAQKLFIRYTILAFTLLTVACATIVIPEYPLLESSLDAKALNPSNTKLVIYNNSNQLFVATAQPMEVRIDKRAVASLRIGEYVQIELPKGVYELQLTYWDILAFSRSHRLEVDGKVMSVAVYSTIASNEITTMEGLPSDRWRPPNFRPYVQK